jgi:hypothetical protein
MTNTAASCSGSGSFSPETGNPDFGLASFFVSQSKNKK